MFFHRIFNDSHDSFHRISSCPFFQFPHVFADNFTHNFFKITFFFLFEFLYIFLKKIQNTSNTATNFKCPCLYLPWPLSIFCVFWDFQVQGKCTFSPKINIFRSQGSISNRSSLQEGKSPSQLSNCRYSCSFRYTVTLDFFIFSCF